MPDGYLRRRDSRCHRHSCHLRLVPPGQRDSLRPCTAARSLAQPRRVTVEGSLRHRRRSTVDTCLWPHPLPPLTRPRDRPPKVSRHEARGAASAAQSTPPTVQPPPALTMVGGPTLLPICTLPGCQNQSEDGQTYSYTSRYAQT